MPSPATHPKGNLRRVGNSVGLTLPKDVLERAGLKEGSTVYLIETDEGLLLRPVDEEFEADMAAYRVIADKYRNTLRELSR